MNNCDPMKKDAIHYLKGSQISYKSEILKNIQKRQTFFINTKNTILLRIFYYKPPWNHVKLLNKSDRLQRQIDENVLFKKKENLPLLEEVIFLTDKEVSFCNILKSNYVDIIVSLNGLNNLLKQKFNFYETALLLLIENIQQDSTFIENLLTSDSHLVGSILIYDYDFIIPHRDCINFFQFPLYYAELDPCFNQQKGFLSKRIVERFLIPEVLGQDNQFKLLQDPSYLTDTKIQLDDCFRQIFSENPYTIGTTGELYFLCGLPWL